MSNDIFNSIALASFALVAIGVIVSLLSFKLNYHNEDLVRSKRLYSRKIRIIEEDHILNSVLRDEIDKFRNFNYSSFQSYELLTPAAVLYGLLISVYSVYDVWICKTIPIFDFVILLLSPATNLFLFLCIIVSAKDFSRLSRQSSEFQELKKAFNDW